jgi:hypothetical protein
MRLHLERRADSKREVRRRAGYGGSEAGVRLPLCHRRGAAEGWYEATVLLLLNNRARCQA